MAKWALYLDESGATEAHHLPLKNGETPVFTLGGVTLPCDSWRNYDREFLYLKREFFAKEINAPSQNDTIWEAKGNYLLGPRNKESIRNRMFVFRMMDLVRKFDGLFVDLGDQRAGGIDIL